jgi:hypothetical protein
MNPRTDRALRIAAGVLGLIVALPVTLAVFFLMVLAWVGNETVLWILIPPLAILGAALTIFAVRALRAHLATALTLGILAALELVVVVFLLVASRPVTGGTIVGAIVAFVAAMVAVVAAVQRYSNRHQPVLAPPPRRSSPVSVTIRKPATATSRPTKRKK